MLKIIFHHRKEAEFMSEFRSLLSSHRILFLLMSFLFSWTKYECTHRRYMDCTTCLLNTFKSEATLRQVGKTWLAFIAPTIPRTEAMPLVNLLGAPDIIGNVVVPQVCNTNSVHWIHDTRFVSTLLQKKDRRLLPSWWRINPLTTSK
jgi:hypothetical protein